jgi:hypothetical protein
MEILISGTGFLFSASSKNARSDLNLGIAHYISILHNASDKYYEYKEEVFRIYNSEDSDETKYDALEEIFEAGR